MIHKEEFGKSLTEIRDLLVLQLFKGGTSPTEIGKCLGVSGGRVKNIIYGVGKKKESRKMSEEDIKKIAKMIEFLVKQKTSEIVLKLPADEKKVYFLTGEKNQNQMVEATRFSAGKISKIWQRLESMGLVFKEKNKYKKVI